MLSGGGNIQQTCGSTSQDTKTKRKKVDTNAYMALSYDSDASFKETNEGDSIKDAIEVTEVPRAPKSKRVQQKQTETLPPMVTNLHLLETIQLSSNSINKLQSEQDHMEETIGEWISNVQQEVEEIRVENETLQEEVGEARIELKEVKAELGEVRAELAKVVALLKSTSASIQQSQQAQQEKCSFAAVASQPAQTPAQTPANREKGVTLSLGKAVATLRGKPLATIKDMAQKEMQKVDATKGVKVVGISAIVGELLEIQTESKEQADIARGNTQWAKALGEEAKVRQAAWYPIKVDSVAREGICKKTGNGWQFKQGLEDLISKSNTRPNFSVKVMKAYWLSKPSNKESGSMAVYLDSWEVAQQVVREGIFVIGANAAYPAPFIQMEKPLRCYRCNHYEHMQSKCKATNPRCGRCAGTHETRDCPGGPNKCAACGGAHRVTDQRCKIWQKQKEQLDRRLQRQRQRHE